MNESDKLVERVAEAISLSFREEGYVEGVSDPAEWAEFQKAARVAIKAMREPTVRMVDSASALVEGDNAVEYTQNTYTVWRRMIDAALPSN